MADIGPCHSNIDFFHFLMPKIRCNTCFYIFLLWAQGHYVYKPIKQMMRTIIERNETKEVRNSDNARPHRELRTYGQRKKMWPNDSTKVRESKGTKRRDCKIWNFETRKWRNETIRRGNNEGRNEWFKAAKRRSKIMTKQQSEMVLSWHAG